MTEKEQRIREVAMIALHVYLSSPLNLHNAVAMAINVGLEFEKQFSERVLSKEGPEIPSPSYHTTSTM